MKELAKKTRNICTLDDNEVKLWMIDNQINKRNTTDFERIELVLMKKPFLAEIAKQRQIEAGGDKKSDNYNKSVVPNLAQPIQESKNKVRTEIAKEAGKSHGSVSSVEKVLKSGTLIFRSP
jgi:hypothetical protein